LSNETRAYLAQLGFGEIEGAPKVYSAPWMHALAIGFSPRYLTEHAEGISIGWPRIPMPNKRADFDRSDSLGQFIANLLDPESKIPTVTSGTTYEHLRVIGSLSSTDLKVKAGWGHKDKQGHVNPGQGRILTRTYTTMELGAISTGAAALKIKAARALELLGPPIDVFLNDTTCWKCIPSTVWEYAIGGYQVLKKWLSYREDSILGRPLSKEEAREVTGIARRITAIVLMTDELDTNYISARDDSFAWPLPVVTANDKG
jgi:Type ISP C-terminal specificity domain